MPDGTVQARQDGRRHLLYLDEGSGGIALAAREYLRHADDPELAAFIAAVRPGCAADFVREPGLFTGRAGLIAVLAHLDHPARPERPAHLGRPTAGTAPRAESAADDRARLLGSVRRLAWHAVSREGALLFPGSGLRRLSADLATGSAGILLALHTAFEGRGELGELLPAW
jgi:hypothetical protein